MVDAHANFATSTVAVAPSPATTGTALTVQTGDGALFSATPFNATVWPVGAQPTKLNAEIVRVTNITGDVVTFTRAQEATTARTILVGDQIAETITVKSFTDIETGYAVRTAASGPHGGPSIIPGITINPDGSISVTDNPISIPRPSKFAAITHSYGMVGGNAGKSFSHVNPSKNWTHLMASVLGAQTDETDFKGHSGAQAGSPYLGNGTTQAGIGPVFRYLGPDHLLAGAGETQPRQTTKSLGALWAFMMMINDPLRCPGDCGTGGTIVNSFKHSVRSVTSFLRTMSLYTVDDTSVAIVGGANVLAPDGNFSTVVHDYVTKMIAKESNTNGSVYTITLPATLKEPKMADLFFLGQPNAVGALGTAITTTTQVGAITVGNASGLLNGGSAMPQSGTFIAKLTEGANTELVKCTASGNTLTIVAGGRNADGNGAHTFTTAALVTRPTSTAHVTVTGTAANASSPQGGGNGSSGNVIALAGQGSAGDPIQMVVRIPVTPADAGKTIVLTFAGIITGDTVEKFSFFGMGLEDPDPDVVELFNQPNVPYGNAWAFFQGTPAINLNAALAAVAAEFDANVPLVDVADYIQRHYGATVQTSLGADNTLNHAAQTIHFTPYDATLWEANTGSVIMLATGEEVLMTGTWTKTSGTDWNSTFTRNYNGVDSSAAVAATNLAVSAGALAGDCAWLNVDRVHPSEIGHMILASKGISTYGALTLTARQIANAGGMVAGRINGVADGLYLPSMAGQRTAVSGFMTAGVMFAVLFDIDDLVNILSLAVNQTGTGGTAAHKLRFGIYERGQGMPGDLILDLGQAPNDASHAAALNEIATDPVTGNPLCIQRTRGLAWGVCCAQGGTFNAAITACAGTNGSSLRYPIQEVDPTANPTQSPIGWTYTNTAGITGALPQKFADMSQAGAVLAKAATVPIMYMKLAAWIHD